MMKPVRAVAVIYALSLACSARGVDSPPLDGAPDAPARDASVDAPSTDVPSVSDAPATDIPPGADVPVAVDMPSVDQPVPADMSMPMDMPVVMDMPVFPDVPAPVDVPIARDTPAPDVGADVPIAPGEDRVWVLRVGDGTAPLAAVAASATIEVYSGSTGAPAGTSIPLPTAASGGNLPFTLTGNAGAEGTLSRSLDGRYVVAGGYTLAVGTTTPNMIAAPRVIARINAAGAVDTRTSLGATVDHSAIRAVATLDGSAFWSVHSTSSDGDVVYTGYNGVPAAAAVTNRAIFRAIAVFGTQLFTTTSTPTGSGLFATASLPRAPGGTIALAPGFPTTMAISPYNVVVFDRSGDGVADVAFLADDRAAPTGGVHCWRLVSGTWTLQGVVAGIPIGLRGMTGRTAGSDYVLYGATTEVRARLLRIDVNAGSLASTVTPLAMAGLNTTFRGVSLAPLP